MVDFADSRDNKTKDPNGISYIDVYRGNDSWFEASTSHEFVDAAEMMGSLELVLAAPHRKA
jgi:hypothetical protein